MLKQQDEFLIDRVRNLKEEDIVGSHYNLNDMKRRLKVYRNENESKVADPSVHQFYREHNVQLFIKDASIKENVMFDSLRIYIERMGEPNNFLHQEESVEAKRRILVKQKQIEQAKQIALNSLIEEGVERELRKQKEQHVKQNLAAIREDQKE